MFRVPWFVRVAIYLGCFIMVCTVGVTSMRTAAAVQLRTPPPGPIQTLAPNGSNLTAAPVATANPLAPDPSESVFEVNPSGASLPKPDITFANITNTISGMQSQLSGFAQNLFIALVGLDVFWMVVQFMLQKDNLGELFGQIFIKIITVSFIFFVVIQHGGELATTIIGSFTAAATKVTTDSKGNKISGYYGGSLNPIDILGEGAGFAAIPVTEAGILDAVPDEILGNGSTNDIKAESEMLTGAAFAIFGVFAGIAAEVAIATLEIYVVLNLGIIVTGFLGSRWTERYGQGFVAYAVSAGVKYFFVIVILGVMYQPLLDAASFEAIPIVGPAMYAAIGLVFAAILHAVPGFAASAMSGSSNASGAQLAGALSQAFGSAGAMVKMGSAGIKNRATESINEKAASEKERETTESDTALASNRQMMREEAGDQRRALGFDDLAAGGSGGAGAGARGVAGSNGAAAALGATAGVGAGFAASGALGGAGGKASAISGASASGNANGALASGAAVNAAAFGSAKVVPGSGTPALKSGSSAAANMANAAAFGSGTSQNALPASSSGAQLGAIPKTAFSPTSDMGQGGYVSADSAAAIAAGGTYGAAPPPKTLGGFEIPQLSDALYGPENAGVGVEPQPFGVPDPPITPLGAASPGASENYASLPPPQTGSGGTSTSPTNVMGAKSGGSLSSSAAAPSNAIGTSAGAATGSVQTSFGPSSTAPSPFASGASASSESGGGHPASTTGSTTSSSSAFGGSTPAKAPSQASAAPQPQSGAPQPPHAAAQADTAHQNVQSFLAGQKVSPGQFAPAPAGQAAPQQPSLNLGTLQTEAALQAKVAKQIATGNVPAETKAVQAEAKRLGVDLPESLLKSSQFGGAKRPSAVSIQKLDQ